MATYRFGDRNQIDAVMWSPDGLPPDVWNIIELNGTAYRSLIGKDLVYPNDVLAPWIDLTGVRAYFIDVGNTIAAQNVSVTLLGKDENDLLISGIEVPMVSSTIQLPIAAGGDDLYHCPLYMDFAYGIKEMKILITNLSGGLCTIRYGTN